MSVQSKLQLWLIVIVLQTFRITQIFIEKKQVCDGNYCSVLYVGLFLSEYLVAYPSNAPPPPPPPPKRDWLKGFDSVHFKAFTKGSDAMQGQIRWRVLPGVS